MTERRPFGHAEVTRERMPGGHLLVRIDFPDWEDDGETGGVPGRIRPRDVFIAINGCMVHIEGIAVERDESGIQVATNDEWSEELDYLYGVYDPGEPFATATIGGREYVIYATPHGD